MKVMGILNVTPDSFSDGGHHFTVKAAVAQAEQMIADGVDVIDIGGESTRPFAEPVALDEELDRVIPVIKALRENHQTPISIDTTKAEVARLALESGANIINDVSSLQHDPAMIELVKTTDVPVIIMHMQGTPGNMQVNPVYSDVVREVIDFFKERLQWLSHEGVDLDRVTIDPGIGFGKKLGHNLSLLKHLDDLHILGRPILLGHSRKRFLGDITGRDTDSRDLTTAVVSALSLSQNIAMVRVHNVAATVDAIKVARAISEAE
jgi:dihydropteroate synthase